MISFLLVAFGATLFAWYLSGTRSLAYLFYFIAFIPFLTFDAEAGGLSSLSALGSSNALFKLSVRVLSSAGMLALLIRRRDAARTILATHSMPVLLFCAWATLGIPMSQTPIISLLRLGELLMFFLTGVVLFLESSRQHGPREVARWHCMALLPLLLVAMWSIVNRPELAFHINASGQGRLGHKMLNANVLAFAAVILTLWGTHELRERSRNGKRWCKEQMVALAILALAIAVMVLTRSRSALVTLVAGQLVLWLPVDRGNPRRRLMVIGLGVAAFAALLTQTDAIFAWVLRDGTTADLMSGTGRTGLWKALLTEQVPKAPITGAGYLMLSNEGAFSHDGTWWINTHNTYLFALVSTGLPGLLALLAIAFLPMRAAFRRFLSANSQDRSSWTLILACQTVVVISGVTGFGICGFPNAVMLFHYALYTWSLSPRRAPQARPDLRLVGLQASTGGAQ